MTLHPDRFGEFFEAVYGYGPFPWQQRLAKRVCSGEWPRAIALPTAAGKTACIDVAVFSLACGAANAVRRVFFVVDRRIVVDQAFEHASGVAKALGSARNGILLETADALREIAFPNWRSLKKDRNEIRPLDVYSLRGGMYRETAWARSPIQPTVVTSTVDQVGSRLLFRGYGVSDSMKPVHAGLVGNDSIILLDEAHCARPFDQTMRAVDKYRKWGDQASSAFHFVSITATPAPGVPIETAEKADYAHNVLGKRLKASKPATLLVAQKAKGKNWRSELVKVLVDQATQLAREYACVGIIVNRVATARELRATLQKEFGEDVVLLTGRMRPLDRDTIYQNRLQGLLSNATGPVPKFVIGTQCLECGADFDFHALVTECASLDALRQRFGRLNRVAARTNAQAVVVVSAEQADESIDDPIYGESLATTWKWLNTKATDGVFDFGIEAVRRAIEGEELAKLNAPTSDAPVMLPAHVDCWVQTHPLPMPDPDPAIFLHGPDKPGQPDVQVVLRRDLGPNSTLWAEIVSLCPPSSSEAVSVPVGLFRRWLEGLAATDTSGDVEGEAEQQDDSPPIESHVALRWRGPLRSDVIDSRSVTPNDVYVIPTSEKAAKLGDFLSQVPADHAEQAFQTSRDRALLRLLDSKAVAEDDDFDKVLTAEIQFKLADNAPEWLRVAVEALKNEKRRDVERHPLGGWVIRGKRRLKRYDPTYLDDSEPDESFRGREVSLADHSIGVTAHAIRFAAACGLHVETYRLAGLLHDAGKLDRRFQAMLRRCSPRTVFGNPLAKSARVPRTKEERETAREVHRYPRGARHELLSAAIAQEIATDDLLLHLIATHHGSARPFSSAVNDADGMFIDEPFTQQHFSHSFRIASSAQRIAEWNPELGERFWRIVRKLGWWGSAYWEAVFRLADHEQSRLEQLDHEDGEVRKIDTRWTAGASENGHPDGHAVVMSGLDGANPLHFLASLGLIAELDATTQSGARMSWSVSDGAWRPSIWTRRVFTSKQIAASIANQLRLGAASEIGDSHDETTLDEADKAHMSAKKKLKNALDDIKKRKLRGKYRETALAEEIAPITAEVDAARKEWLRLLKVHSPSPELALGKDPAALRGHFRLVANEIANDVDSRSRACADLMAAFGCDAIADDKSGRVRATSFCFVTGSGHQYFLQNARDLMAQVDEPRIERALFEIHPHADPKSSMRWDPVEDRRYAVMWADPTSAGNEAKTNWALNLLAYRGLQLLPSVPIRNGLQTTGFSKHDGSLDWSWPVWTPPYSCDSIRSLLALHSLQSHHIQRLDVVAVGIAEVFRASRIQVGNPPLHKLNFTPSTSV